MCLFSAIVMICADNREGYDRVTNIQLLCKSGSCVMKSFLQSWTIVRSASPDCLAVPMQMFVAGECFTADVPVSPLNYASSFNFTGTTLHIGFAMYSVIQALVFLDCSSFILPCLGLATLRSTKLSPRNSVRQDASAET